LSTSIKYHLSFEVRIKEKEMKRKISLKGSNFSSVKKASKQKLEIYEFFGGNKKFKLT